MNQNDRPSWKQILWIPVYDAIEKRWGQWGLRVLAGLIAIAILVVGSWRFVSNTTRERKEKVSREVVEGAAEPIVPATGIRQSSKQIADPRVSSTSESDPIKTYVRESSATEVVEVMERYSSHFEQKKKFSEIFKGKWIRDPGWRGKVQSEARKNGSLGAIWGIWSIGIVELDGETYFTVRTDQNLSNLRKGDVVAVIGQLESYYYGGVPAIHKARITPVAENK